MPTPPRPVNPFGVAACGRLTDRVGLRHGSIRSGARPAPTDGSRRNPNRSFADGRQRPSGAPLCLRAADCLSSDQPALSLATTRAPSVLNPSERERLAVASRPTRSRSSALRIAIRGQPRSLIVTPAAPSLSSTCRHPLAARRLSPSIWAFQARGACRRSSFAHLANRLAGAPRPRRGKADQEHRD